MAFNRKQIVVSVSIVYLILATALAGYATYRTNDLSVPIPRVLSGFTTALPIVAGLLLEGGYDFTKLQERRRLLPRGDTTRPPLVIVANTLIFIFSTVVITLLGTHAAPASGLDCGLREHWQSLFHRKRSEDIRRIQDAFNCCGFKNPRDMAWPFPGKNVDQCSTAFGRTSGCFPAWKAEEQRLAGIFMAVVGLVFIWQFAFIAIPTKRESWLHQVVPDRVSRIIADEEHSSSGGLRRAIDYRPNGHGYRDNEAEEVSDDSDAETRPQRTLESGAQQAKNSRPGGNGEQQHPLIDESVWGRE
ncbi:hypothetical protein BDV95DRAFT_585010 [Massariosphaeria phaeospora]|uniref:Tetraspanin Tsp3 n=1 Tax=Massariosphaeria phaeospora TaxID=100035 RepID=A0A7C8M0K8_9PLEO|nr:hypothetical protein BDV95DRAFT_585010 [Massariosphaeria phaeospora]